jgi:general secretion pathway protein D
VLGALFRSRSSGMTKTNLILVLTPYIIREQQDLRTVFERKMQERQEFLDHYFVFAEQNEYEAPKDYSRTNGLLEDIRQTYIEVDEQRRLDDLTRRPEMRTHSPGQPLELPLPIGETSSGGTTRNGPPPAPTAPGEAAPAAPALNVAPPSRSFEKIEK